MNLKDRMKSDLPSLNPTETEKPSESVRAESLNDTMQKSKQLSREMELLEKQSEAISKLQTELAETKKTDQEKIQHLSSENSGLKKELQKKSEMIVSLNEWIEKMSESDLIVKQNEQLQKDIQEAMTTVGAVKEEYEKKEKLLASKIQDAEQREAEAYDLTKNYRSKVNEEATRITERKRDELNRNFEIHSIEIEKKFNAKKNAIYAITEGAIVYSFFLTILEAFKSERFLSDMVLAFEWVWNNLKSVIQLATMAASATWQIKDKIPYEVVDVIAAGLLTAIVFLLIVGLIYGTVGFLIGLGVVSYHKHYWDIISVIVALTSNAILVLFADSLTFITWNLIVVWLVIHLAYILLRMILESSQNHY